jgi:hypothetical protein
MTPMREERATTRRAPMFVFRALVCATLCLLGIEAMAQEAASGFRTIEKGSQSNVDATRRAVARTPDEWTALWKAHNYDKPAPHVDFDREMVIALFMGSRPTGGFSVQIVSVAEHQLQGGGLLVTYHETSPKAGAITVQVLTFPYHIVAVPKHSGTVTFEMK